MLSTCILIPSPRGAASDLQRFQRIKLVNMIHGSTYHRRRIDATINSHQVEGWGSAIRIQLFCHAANIKQQNYLDSVDRLHSSTTPNSMAQQLPASTTSHMHTNHASSHISNIILEIKRSMCRNSYLAIHICYRRSSG